MISVSGVFQGPRIGAQGSCQVCQALVKLVDWFLEPTADFPTFILSNPILGPPQLKGSLEHPTVDVHPT